MLFLVGWLVFWEMADSKIGTGDPKGECGTLCGAREPESGKNHKIQNP